MNAHLANREAEMTNIMATAKNNIVRPKIPATIKSGSRKSHEMKN
jgi:hypothetical protein